MCSFSSKPSTGSTIPGRFWFGDIFIVISSEPKTDNISLKFRTETNVDIFTFVITRNIHICFVCVFCIFCMKMKNVTESLNLTWLVDLFDKILALLIELNNNFCLVKTFGFSLDYLQIIGYFPSINLQIQIFSPKVNFAIFSLNSMVYFVIRI